MKDAFAYCKNGHRVYMTTEKNVEIENLALKVLGFVKKNKEAYLSDLVEEFKVDPPTMIKAINLLKERKMIRRAE